MGKREAENTVAAYRRMRESMIIQVRAGCEAFTTQYALVRSLSAVDAFVRIQ